MRQALIANKYLYSNEARRRNKDTRATWLLEYKLVSIVRLLAREQNKGRPHTGSKGLGLGTSRVGDMR
jgi:hypothetical protein